MEVVTINPDLENDWSAFIASHPDATPYHTREWARVIQHVFGYEDNGKLCVADDGQIVGVLPLWKTRGKRMDSSPWRDRGTLLTESLKVRDVMLSSLNVEGHQIQIRGYHDLYFPTPWRVEDYWVTSVFNLADGMPRRGLSVERNVRKAASEGVNVVSQGGRKFLDEFYSLFCLTRKRLGVPIYPRRLFGSIMDEMGVKACIHLAQRDGLPLAAVLILSFGHISIYAYGGSDPAFQALRPMDATLWKAMEIALAEGRQVFDFGSDSPFQTSLLNYKKKWGSIQMPMPILKLGCPTLNSHDFSSDQMVLVRAIFSRLPIMMLKGIGELGIRING